MAPSSATELDLVPRARGGQNESLGVDLRVVVCSCVVVAALAAAFSAGLSAGSPATAVAVAVGSGRDAGRAVERDAARDATRQNGQARADDERQTLSSPYADIELTPFERAKDGTIALQVTVRPRPGIHIYAPGQRGYYPVSVTFPAGSGLKPVRLDLPSAEPYVFEPTGERFLVYRQPFAVTQHVRVARATTAARVSRVSGTLHYQACDDRVCYRPQAVRLEWSRRRATTARTGGAS